MPKIYIEYDNVRTNNYLQDAIRYLKIADDIYLNTPNGFSRYNEVNRLKSTLKSVNTDLERLLDWLETSQKNYSDFIDEAISEVNKIEKIKVKSITSIVR